MKPIYKIEVWNDKANCFTEYDRKSNPYYAQVVAEAHVNAGYHTRIIHNGKTIWEGGVKL